jgi:ABC-type dipeptide/oligopeptide/nickel transport system permease component
MTYFCGIWAFFQSEAFIDYSVEIGVYCVDSLFFIFFCVVLIVVFFYFLPVCEGSTKTAGTKQLKNAIKHTLTYM